MPNEVMISLGSNIDAEANLRLAVVELKRRFNVLKRSQWMRTKPIGILDQPDFYNAAISLHTTMPPEQLLKTLLSTETKMGRKRLRHWGERCIDLDLLTYDRLEITSPDLVLPHPRAHQRRFVLDPLIELLGEDYCLPGMGTLESLQAQCAGQAIRVLCDFPR